MHVVNIILNMLNVGNDSSISSLNFCKVFLYVYSETVNCWLWNSSDGNCVGSEQN